MATIKPITKAQFESLMENLGDFYCDGYSRNSDAKSDNDWDTLSFFYDSSSVIGIEFTLAHPYSHVMNAINYDVIEIRFSKTYPFRQEWGFRIDDPKQIQRLSDAVLAPYHAYRKKRSDDRKELLANL